MDFVVKINMDNDAFYNDSGVEVARILRGIIENIEGYGDLDDFSPLTLRDYNGNYVGKAEVRTLS